MWNLSLLSSKITLISFHINPILTVWCALQHWIIYTVISSQSEHRMYIITVAVVTVIYKLPRNSQSNQTCEQLSAGFPTSPSLTQNKIAWTIKIGSILFYHLSFNMAEFNMNQLGMLLCMYAKKYIQKLSITTRRVIPTRTQILAWTKVGKYKLDNSMKQCIKHKIICLGPWHDLSLNIPQLT